MPVGEDLARAPILLRYSYIPISINQTLITILLLIKTSYSLIYNYLI
jgi:hypothetical protein